MKTLIQDMRRGGASAPLLPDLHPLLAAETIRVRRGQMIMLTATPGGGKSLLALHYCVSRNPGRVLYFSLDTDLGTMRMRAAAMKTGLTVDEIEGILEQEGGEDFIEDALAELSESVRWCDDARSMEDIDDEIQAFVEVYGCYPDLVVLDVLLNVDNGGEDWSGSMRVMGQLHSLAHSKGPAVMVLHHNAERRADQSVPAPRGDMIMKVAQYPEVVLSLALAPQERELRVSAVKNRSGKADPSAPTYISLPVDLPRMSVYDSKQEMHMAEKKQEWT